jgi:hypothetical protein
MGRKLKRVPLDFDAPLNKTWRGYTLKNASEEDYKNFPHHNCKDCEIENSHKEDFCMEEETSYCVFYHSKWREKWHEEPPTGIGYQMWENTSEGSPQTPVFKTLEELAEYCAENCTTFADYKATKEEWHKMLNDNNVHCTMGNVIFI